MAAREEALRWLAQQLRWEITLEALRAEAAAEDVVVEAERTLIEAAADRSRVSDRPAA
jgi:hypothetical protein